MKPSCKRTGLTLPELILGITVTAVIGLAVAGVAMALSTGYSQSSSYVDSVRSAQVGAIRITDEVNGASLVTAVDSQRLSLWSGDANGDGQINLTEMSVVSYEPNAREIARYRAVFPGSWPSWLKLAMDVDLSLCSVSNAVSTESLVRNPAYTERKVLASDVTGFAMHANRQAPLTTLVQMQITTGQGSSACTVSTSAGLRVDKTSRVVVGSNDTYYLGN